MPYLGRQVTATGTTLGDLKITGTLSADSINHKISFDQSSAGVDVDDHIVIEDGGTDGSGTNASDNLLLEDVTPNLIPFSDINSGTSTSGHVLTSQGDGASATFAAGGGGLQSMQVFTSTGTYTKPDGINRIKVTVVGGGGGGGNNSANSSSGDIASGGGAGGAAIKIIDASSISTESVTIGAGGNGATSGGHQGSAGGTSSFGSHCSATGGTGGKGGTNSPNSDAGLPGPGGSGSSGTVNITGMNGFGGDQQGMLGGAGGASILGAGGNYTFNQGSTPTTGQAGSQGGGGGAGNQSGGSGDSEGGNGGAGIVVVEEFK